MARPPVLGLEALSSQAAMSEMSDDSSIPVDDDLRVAVGGRRILIGITGGIATYKLATVVSALAQAGAEVTVAMTDAATRFVAPLTFQALSGRAVLTSSWTEIDPGDPQHIAVARRSDVMLIAPCTMDAMARLAAGRGDEIVALLAASIDRIRTPVLVSPSMNDAMWNQPATQRSLRTLAEDGFVLIGPEHGWQACRTVGVGRLPAPARLVAEVVVALRGSTRTASR